uniref:hypothetical protein n=1 Tax=Thiohalocapsa sp. TaxID=2497641 RepID=UPI0025E90474
SYGRGIPYTYGTVPVTGNVIWADEIQEVRNEEGGSKKKGTPTVVHYTYFATFAVLVGDGPITGIRRIIVSSCVRLEVE